MRSVHRRSTPLDESPKFLFFVVYVIFLYLGELIEQGPAQTIFTQPSNPRTKACIEGVLVRPMYPLT